MVLFIYTAIKHSLLTLKARVLIILCNEIPASAGI